MVWGALSEVRVLEKGLLCSVCSRRCGRELLLLASLSVVLLGSSCGVLHGLKSCQWEGSVQQFCVSLAPEVLFVCPCDFQVCR